MATKQVPGRFMAMDLNSWLLAGGVVGPLLFIVVFLIEGATRPGYIPGATTSAHSV